MKKSEFVDWLAGELTYDGSFDETCPHCGAILNYGYRYLDHTSSLSQNIISKLGYPASVVDYLVDAVLSYVENFCPSDSQEHDAITIAQFVEDALQYKFE